MKKTDITCPNGHEEFEAKILGTKPDPKLMVKCKECGANKTIPILIGLWTTSSWAPKELSIDEEAEEELLLPKPEKFPEPIMEEDEEG